MAQITLKIQVNENAGTSLNFNTASQINNVSSSLSKKTTKNDGVDGISFATGSISLANGYLGNGSQFQSEKDKYNGYMFGATDENGYYSLKLTVSGDNLDKIVIHFDKNANQFATEAIIDNNKTIYSDDPVWAIDFGTETTSHTIEFTKWNRPNYNACFTLIQIMLEYFELNKNWIDNLESLSQTTTNAENIEYGMLASSGSVNVLDNEGYIADLITDGALNPSNIPVELYINNTLIQKHITTSSTYDTDGNTLSINFSNSIENFSKLKYKGYNYPEEPRTAYDMFYDVLNNYYDGKLTYEKFETMLSDKIVYGENNNYGPIYSYLKNIQIEYPFIESNRTYTEVINDFCELAQLQAFLTDKGELKFLSARPVVPMLIDGIDYIFMPPDSVSTYFEEDLILKNKYNDIELSEYKVEDFTDFGTLLASPSLKIENLNILEETNNSGSDNFATPINSYNAIASISYIDVKSYYITGDITISVFDNQNLSKILYVFESIKRDNLYTYDNVYNYTTGSASATVKTSGGIKVSNISFSAGSTPEQKKGQILNNESHSYTYKQSTYSVTSNVEISGINKSEILSVTYNNDDTITIKFKVLCGKRVTKLNSGFRWASANNLPVVADVTQYNITETMSGTYEYYEPVSVALSIYGNKRVISFNESVAKSNDTGGEKTIYSSSSNTLINDKTRFDGKNISKHKIDNILFDYKNGIKTAKTTINGINLYDKNGNLAKDWNKGEIINNGDILGFSNKRNKDGSIIYWKNVGRKFLYDGEPLTEIEIMECKPVELYTDSGQFWDMNYSTFQKSLRELSNQKAIVVSNDYTSLSAGENVSSLEGFLAIPKTVTSLTGDFSSATGFTGMKFEIPNEISIKVPSTIFYLDVDIDKWAEKSFDSSILRGNTYFAKNGQAINNLEINSKYIGDYAFCNYAGTNVTFGDSVGSIGMYSFKNSKITSIIIPNSVKTIFREAFNNCYNLSSLKLGNSITELGYGSFMYCSSLTEITIPASVTYINRMSFYGCSSLTKITFENPNGWKSTQTGESIDLSDPAKNVTLLTQTYAEQNIAIF